MSPYNHPYKTTAILKTHTHTQKKKKTQTFRFPCGLEWLGPLNPQLLAYPKDEKMTKIEEETLGATEDRPPGPPAPLPAPPARSQRPSARYRLPRGCAPRPWRSAACPPPGVPRAHGGAEEPSSQESPHESHREWSVLPEPCFKN